MNGYIKADMHTHSVFSHDSECQIADMCKAQIKCGTNIFAVTDHCDVYSFNDYDIFTPVKYSFLAVKELKKQFKDKCLILSGVEISEGFWFKKQHKIIHDLCNYDVIIGSVHCVKSKLSELAYSSIDFSNFSLKEIEDYLTDYFEDVLRVAKTYDIDILAHLTCPVRYICGKYGFKLDLSKYDDIIDRILSEIITRKIALEVNTSCFEKDGILLPDVRIIKKYFYMGGELITVGSDAHIAKNASANFDFAHKTLKDIGFKYLYYYKGRKPKKYKII